MHKFIVIVIASFLGLSALNSVSNASEHEHENVSCSCPSYNNICGNVVPSCSTSCTKKAVCNCGLNSVCSSKNECSCDD